MDIAGISMEMGSLNLATAVSTAVLSKNLDTIEVMGDSMIKMMEQSVTPNLGQNIDISL